MKRINIFKTGTHTSMGGAVLSFSEADLEAVATSYDMSLHEAPLVVGHPKSDGPAYGWVKNVQFEDGELYVVPHQVDEAFAGMVTDGKFKKISAAFYSPGSDNNPTPGSYHLRHVGFLGAQPPSVKGLKAIEFSEDDDLVVFEFSEIDGWTFAWVLESVGKLFKGLRENIIERDGVEKADEILPSHAIDDIVSASGEARAAAREDSGSNFVESDAVPGANSKHQSQIKKKESPAMPDKDKQNAAKNDVAFQEREDNLSEREQKLREQEAMFAEQQRRTEAGQFIDGLVTDGKLPPMHRDGLVAFMASLDAEDTIEFGEGDNAKTKTPGQYFKAFLEGLGKTIEFTEVSAPGDEDAAVPGNFTAPAGYDVDPEKARINAAALDYQEKNGCDFATAVTAVTNKS